MFVALTPETARIGQRVCPTDARTLLPSRCDVYIIQRFIHNEHGCPCAVLSMDGRWESCCVPTDTLWLKS